MSAEAKKVMVVGNGGREQALAWKLTKSPHVSQIFMLPGNPGTDDIAHMTGKLIENIEVDPDNFSKIIDTARQQDVQLVIVGSENQLVKGLGDELALNQIPAIAPPEAQAQLETSKFWTRQFCEEYGIAQPLFTPFTNERDAQDYVAAMGIKNAVVKADGLANGKGVIVCDSQEETIAAIRTIKEKLPQAAETILLEERLYGIEISCIALTDGWTSVQLPTAKDHKRQLDGDQGPNTGGMGAISPNPAVTPEIAAEIQQAIIQPAITGMAHRGLPFRGVLYAGIMLTKDGPKLLEFNVRFGDPETQAQLPLFHYDLYDVLTKVASGKLTDLAYSREPRFPRASCVVVLAAENYPENPRKGDVIHGLATAQARALALGGIIFQAGTKTVNGKLMTKGGRVLNMVGTGDSKEAARNNCYEVIEYINFDGMQYRTDIGT